MNGKVLGTMAALALVFAAGCATLENTGWNPDPASDAGIQAAANLVVTVENGLATLTGTVPDAAVRARAIQILENTDGIFEVRDHTRIL